MVGRLVFAHVARDRNETKTEIESENEMGKTMAEINVQKSRYFKVADLLKATGKPWALAQLPVVVESAEMGEYPGDGDSPAEDAFFIYFKGHEKPLGCNLTNRKVLQGIVGDDAEWTTASLRGVSLIVYAESTSMGTGIRVRYNDAASKAGGDPIRDEEPSSVSEDVPPPDDDDEPPF